MDINRLKELAGVPQQLNEDLTRSTKSRPDASTLETMRMAGIAIEEAYDDDDEDPDVKIANSDKRQKEFEKKNAPALKAAEKKVASADAKAEDKGVKAAKAEDDKPAAKAEDDKPAAKAEDDKPAAPAAAKAKGRAPTERGAGCRAWYADHPGATRSQFIAHCTGLGMTVANANTTFYSIKKKSAAAATNEAFMIFHPLDSGTVLAENARMRRYEWVNIAECTDYTEPLVFESEFEAQTIVDGVGLVSQAGVVVQTLKDGQPLELI